ncbi:transcriptional regulator [Knoellia flava TL1]|uniref:WYL domain-containing protein n=2 Tax=Knoellia flava TaxID=913969 RepID=A0A8H9FQL8_9MICO|nr:WYL domain-containing protein [Knoellia flava]KGN30338.1 transcriptional regulator [Knoellia flava TL1]GGB66549.1 WYL domain-containing protein [Knoellia flava]
MSAAQGPAAKTERLLNLVLVLLYTRRPLAKAQIRGLVPQYGETASTEAFDRMFERDKDELRALGVPLVTEEIDVLHEDEPGYRIHQRDYALPDIEFEPDELAVLGLASRSWAQASMAGPAAQALRKLRAAGVERDDAALIGIEPRLRTTEPAFDAVKDAVLSRTPITFGYRRPERAEAQVRTVQPWSLVQWHGRWYLAGHDLDRDDTRVFRLSRIDGTVRTAGRAGSFDVPDGFEARVLVESSAPRGDARVARLLVRPGAGHSLRRRATSTTETDGGWSELTLDFHDVDGFAAEVTGHGDDVQVVEPEELAERVRSQLRAVLAVHEAGA